MSIARWSVNNRVAVNMLVVALLVTGIFAAATRLSRDIFPDVSTNYIRIITFDPTTSLPEDIEKLISIPIEENVAGVNGLQTVVSFSQDNLSTVFLEIDPSINEMEPILNDVRQQVSIARRELPPSAEEPLVEIFDIPLPLITFGVMLPVGFDIAANRMALDQLERDLRQLRGVSDVLVAGLNPREAWIEVDPYRAEVAGISFAEIAQAVGQQSRNWTGGRMATVAGERAVRLQGEFQSIEGIEEIALRASGDRVLRLRDIATVKETQEQETWRGRVNLRPGITYTIVKKRGTDAIDTARAAESVFRRAMERVPEGVEGQVVSDSTKYINVRIQTVLQNGIQALVIVTVLLVMLLNWRLAVLIAIGLPISFAGTFLVLYWMGETLNLLSLFAMIMAIGMIVDDALVVAENVYRYYEEGYSRIDAAVRGTMEVVWPVLGSVSTTIAAFLPLILGEGIIGKFLAIVPLVVISGLAFSLVQAFVVLPSHLADFVRQPLSPAELERKLTGENSTWRRIYYHTSLVYAEMRVSVDRFLNGVIETYTHLLVLALRYRYFAVLGFFLLLAGGGALLALGVLRFQLFDTDFSDRIYVKADLPSNYSLDQTEEVITRLERRIAEEIPETDLAGMVTQIGARLNQSNEVLHYGTNLSMITLDLDEQNPASRRPSIIERDLRRILLGFPELVEATAESETGGPPVGRPVNVRIRGEDFDTLRAIATQVERRLREMEGVTNIANDFVPGKPEFLLRVNEERALQAGLTADSVGRQLQGAYRGLEAARLRWGNDEVRVRVIMDERFRGDPEVLQNLRVPNNQGQNIPLSLVTDLEQTGGIARINRRDQQRLITVTADVDTRVVTSREANTEIARWIPEMERNFPGYRLSLAGESEDTARSLEAMQFAALIAILLIYVILAVIFNSFLQPLMVMSVIPFGVIGVIGGLLFMGQAMGLMSVMGTIALAGIVVNNSVVFVDFINRRRNALPGANGSAHALYHLRLARWHTIMESARIRFRPIFLTTATTIGGLFTLAFTTRGQEEFLAPMAQAIIFGLLFASLITMILIPCLYSIIDDVAAWKDRVSSRPPKE
jgi:multidrug efflux pump subunit AcrB